MCPENIGLDGRFDRGAGLTHARPTGDPEAAPRDLGDHLPVRDAVRLLPVDHYGELELRDRVLAHALPVSL